MNSNVPGGPSTTFWLDSAFGVPGLEAGTYTGRVEFAQGAGAEPLAVSDIAAYWVR